MSDYQEKFVRHTKRKKKIEDTEQASEPDMAGMLESSYWEFKRTITNIPGTLMDKVEGMPEQMSKVSRKMEILRKHQKEMLEIKDTTTEM